MEYLQAMMSWFLPVSEGKTIDILVLLALPIDALQDVINKNTICFYSVLHSIFAILFLVSQLKFVKF